MFDQVYGFPFLWIQYSVCTSIVSKATCALQEEEEALLTKHPSPKTKVPAIAPL